MANKITAHNVETGEVVIRDLTKEEIDQIKIDNADEIKLKAAAESKAAQRQLILDKLGLTADEAKLLIS